ncbi:hypothetical protein [Staphylospora marina]|uniref:hypothetical protein n=1 Tax=Staphylospora marina TaxID=2490858 RepID=UPI0013DDB512|nr:hypothetical protein [Staphylospora marina]
MEKVEKHLFTIRCNRCGERYTLKGRIKKGKVETGLKRCLCDNENDFEIHRKEP